MGEEIAFFYLVSFPRLCQLSVTCSSIKPASDVGLGGGTDLTFLSFCKSSTMESFLTTPLGPKNVTVSSF